MSQVNNQELFKENKNDSQQKNPIVFTSENKEIDQQIGLKSNVSLPSVNGNAGADVGDMKTEEKKSGSADSQQKAQKENELVNVAPRVIREIKNVANNAAGAEPQDADEQHLTQKQRAQKKRNDAKEKIKSYREGLQSMENIILTGTAGARLQRESWSRLGSINKKKRIDAALERENNADRINEYLHSADRDKGVFSEVHNSEEVKSFVSDFLNNIQDVESDIASDDKFVSSLKYNYYLTRYAAWMKTVITDAADKGYLPEGIDLDAVQQKIAHFEELKKYLDARVKVVTSPYYKYFSSEDVNYSDVQLKTLIENYDKPENASTRSEHRELYDYLTAVRELRDIGVNRKKGIGSREKIIEQRARHEVEMMRTRTEKKHIIAGLTEQSRRIVNEGAAGARDYAKSYTTERFNILKEEFDRIGISDISFGSLKDMTDNYEVNAGLFEQAREMRSMFETAGQRGDLNGWNENDILKLRAKLRSFDAMEKLFNNLRERVISNPADMVEKYTYDEILSQAVNMTREADQAADIRDYPGFGSNLEKLYKSILKNYKDERKKNKAGNKQAQNEAVAAGQEAVHEGAQNAVAGHEEAAAHVYVPGINELIGRLGKSFREKKIKVHDREDMLTRAGTDQQHKYTVRNTFVLNREKVADDVFGIKNSLPLETKMKLSDEALNDLAALMNGMFKQTTAESAGKMRDFVESYANDRERDNAMDRLTESILNLPVEIRSVGPSGDAVIANNAIMLEDVSRKAYAFRRLLADESNSEYVKKLKSRLSEGGVSDYDKVTAKLDQMFAYSDYYRACKLLMTDNYYILHGNDEIGMSNTRSMTPEQRRVYQLIRLTEAYARRIRSGMFEGRSTETGQDRLLDRYERENAGQAFLTGRSDMSKADCSAVKKSHQDFSDFLDCVRKEANPENIKYFLVHYDPRQCPGAEKYRTEDVENILQAIRFHFAGNDFEDPRVRENWTAKEIRVYKKLMPFGFFTEIGADGKPKTDEDGKLVNTNVEIPYMSMTPQVVKNGKVVNQAPDVKENLYVAPAIPRYIKSLSHSLSDELPEEELADILDGLTFVIRHKPDMNNAAVKKYARDRWLRSIKKVFDLWYNSLKSFERTYGSLSMDMPVSLFLHTLGKGQKDYMSRSEFAQDITQLAGEQSAVYEGEPMSLGQILVKEKLLDQSVLDDMIRKGAQLYQLDAGSLHNYYQMFDLNFSVPDGNNLTMLLSGGKDAMAIKDYTRRNVTIDGPALKQSDQRKYWKQAMASGYKGLTASKERMDNVKKSLKLLSTAERNDLKRQREKDKNIYNNTCKVLGVRAKNLYNETIDRLSAHNLSAADKALVRKMVAFHPGLNKDADDTKAGYVKDRDEFMTNLTGFLGLGEQDAAKIKENKAKAFEYFCAKASKLANYSKGVVAFDSEDIMSSDNVREINDVVLDSKLVKMEACHMMFDALQDMASDRKELNWTTPKLKRQFDRGLLENLRIEIIRSTMTDSYYLNLGDLGDEHRTLKGCRYNLLQGLGEYKTQYMMYTLEKDVLGDPETMDALREFGITIRPMTVPEEKQEEKKEEKKEEKQKAEGADDEKQDDKSSLMDIDDLLNMSGGEEDIQDAAPNTINTNAEKLKTGNAGDNKINVDEEIAEQINKKLFYELPAVKYDENVTAPINWKNKPVAYESQGKGKVYCWACVMSGLMNSYAGTKVTSLGDILKHPFKIPSFKDSGIKDRKTYDEGVSLIKKMYAGKEYGNPVILGDYIQEKLPDAAVRTAMISREEGRLPYCKRRFLETLSSNLKKGPIGMLVGGHYVMIRELRGDVLMVNDSMGRDPDALVPYYSTVSQLFGRVGKEIELVWLENTANREKEVAEEFDLGFDEKTGEYSFREALPQGKLAPGQVKFDQVHNSETILHKNGIEASANLVDDVVFNFVYLPKKKKDDKNRINDNPSIYPASSYMQISPEEDKIGHGQITVQELEAFLGKDTITERLSDQYEGFTKPVNAILPDIQGDKAETVKAKNDIREHLLKEQREYIRYRKEKSAHTAPYLHTAPFREQYIDGDQMDHHHKNPKLRAAFRELMISRNSISQSITANSAMLTHFFAMEFMNGVVKPLAELDLKQFEIRDDAGFVSRFGEKYDQLCKIEAYEEYCRLYCDGLDKQRGGNNLCAFRAKLELMKSIRTAYEDRMKLISSPYYTLLGADYMKSFAGKGGEDRLEASDLDAGIKDYIRLYNRVMANPLTANGINKEYRTVLDRIQRTEGEADIARVKAFLKGIKPSLSNAEILEKAYSKAAKANLKAIEKDDIKFLRTGKVFGVLEIQALTMEEKLAYNHELADILEKGTFRGTRLSEAVLKKLRPMIHQYAENKRKYDAADIAKTGIDNLTGYALGCDTKNPVYADSDTGKLIKRLSDDDASVLEVDRIITAKNKVLFDNAYNSRCSLIDIFDTIIQSNVTFNAGLQDKMNDKELSDAALNKAVGELEVKSIRVNGEKYQLYFADNFLTGLDELDIRMKASDQAKLSGLINGMIENGKKMSVVSGLYSQKSGDSIMLDRIHLRHFKDTNRSDMAKVMKLLSKYGVDASGEIPVKYRMMKQVGPYNKSFNEKFVGTFSMLEKEISEYVEKNGNDKLDTGNRLYTSLASCMYHLNQVSLDGCRRMAESLSINNINCTTYELNAKARAYDQIFHAVMQFNLSRFRIDKLDDILDPKHMEARLMVTMMSNFDEARFREYEDLIDNKEVKCALTREQLNEVRARYRLFADLRMFGTYADLYEKAKDLKVDIKAELKKSSQTLMEESDANLPEEMERLNFLADLGALKRDIEEGAFRFGEDPAMALERVRTKDYKLGPGHENIEEARENLEARIRVAPSDDFEKYEPSEKTNYKPAVSQTPHADKLRKLYEKIDFEFANSGLSKEKLQEMKDNQKELFEYNLTYTYNVDAELLNELGKDNSVDSRGIMMLLRPVHVDEQGQPLTDIDRKNKELNNEDARKFLSGSLKERKPLLDRFAEEVDRLVFTDAELRDPAFIRRNKERALRFLTFCFNMENMYTSHREYYQKHADKKVKATMYTFFEATNYNAYAAYHILHALQTDGMGNEGFNAGGSSMTVVAHIPFFRGADYNEIMKQNNDAFEKLDYETASLYLSDYSSQYKSMLEPLDKEGLEQSKQVNSVGYASMRLPEYTELKKRFGKNKDIKKREKFTPDQRVTNIVELTNEYYAGRNNEEYLNRMEQTINDYRENLARPNDIINHSSVKNDL